MSVRKIGIRVTTFIIVLLVIAAIGWFIISGFQKTYAVYMGDYEVSQDGTELTFNYLNANSMGYVRDMKDDYADGVHKLTFYQCWGGLNSSIGHQSTYTIHLNPEDTEIYCMDGQGMARLVLHKDPETGSWIR